MICLDLYIIRLFSMYVNVSVMERLGFLFTPFEMEKSSSFLVALIEVC